MAALAVRGYDVDNLGRSLEPLEHRAYGPVVADVLDTASQPCSDAIHDKVDLAAYIRNGVKATLETFPQDVALIVALEIA